MFNPLLQNNPPAAVSPNGTVAVTALPNGWDGNSLKLTLLFTLSLADGKSMAEAKFDRWASPTNALANLLRTGQWTLTFTNANAQLPHGQFTVTPQPYPLRADIWDLLFRGDAAKASSARVSKRKKTPWHVAHDAAFTDYAIKKHRFMRAQVQYAQRNAPKAEFLKNTALLDDQFAFIDVYLHPSLGNTSDISIKNQLDVRRSMLDPANPALYVPTLMSPALDATNIALLKSRFQWCFDLLDCADQPLAPVGLFACWRHCVVSLPISSDLKHTLTDIIETVAHSSDCKLLSAAVRQAQSNVEFLLNSRKKQPDDTGCAAAPPSPDFHQMLGMVNRFPALLRPLGLAVDVKVDCPAGFDYTSVTLLTMTAPAGATNTVCFQTAAYIGKAGGNGPLEFCARSQYEAQIARPTDPKNIDDEFRLLQNRYLWLQATSKLDDAAALFYTTSQDSTGMLNKMQNASFAYQRGSQYRQYPTGDSAHKTAPDTVPSARTMGIQLFHVARVARSQQSAADPPSPTAPRVLYADDLILGYRVDMHDGRKDQNWFPLCARKSSYQSTDQNVTWNPTLPVDCTADEGFVTLGGLVEDTDDGTSTLIHMHQGVFTWNGESLSSKPFFDTGSNIPANPVFPLIPSYDIVGDQSELPLRFEKNYSIRCRVVDLAGNSPPCGEYLPGDGKDVTLVHSFQREEPYRGPQILLRESIQRKRHPGEDIATLVLRDGGGQVERAVVPPRETRHLAEWAGKLDGGLGRGAFEEFWLDPDIGRFITVQELEDGLPVQPDKIDSERQDGILRGRASVPRDRYFPDPYILYACIQFKQDTPWKDAKGEDAKTQYLRFYKDENIWPNASPVLLRLLPTDDGQPYVKPYNSRLLDSDVFANTPVLEFYLPKYMDTIIEVSSAAKGDGSAPETSVHLAITQPLSRPPASAGGNKQSSAHGISQPMLVASNSNADPNADPNRSLLDAMKTAQLTLDHPSWNDGTNPSTSPPHQIRLVHAVKQPRQPTVTGLALARRYGETIANVGGTLKPHVASTGKVTFHASYDLVIDNPARPKPYSAHYKEVAFEVNLPTARPGQTGSQSDYLKDKKHVFHDSRARLITYSTVSTSKFLGFYANAATHQSEFEILQTLPEPVQLKATVRPPAPVVSYIIPAFRWEETTVSGQCTRTCHPYLRVYVERPFKVTDNDQMLAALLLPRSADPDAASSLPVKKLVSKIGLDPLQGNWSQRGFAQAEMNAGMFTNHLTPDTSFLVECTDNYKADSSVTGAVDILPFETNFADNRNLWFADIAISAVQSGSDGKDFQLRSPFIQFALASYAPNGLQGTSPVDDARISAVVLADFVQLAENRYCTIVRNGNTITLSISGPFVSNGNAPATNGWNAVRKRWEWSRETRISVELQHRWHSVEEEMSCLPVDMGNGNKSRFEFVPDDAHGLGTLKVSFTLPHSPNWFKYAVLVMEEEILPGKDGSDWYRPRYFDQIEI